MAWQTGLIVFLSLLAGLVLDDWGSSLALFYGGVAALLNTGLLWWRWWQGAKRIHSEPGRHLKTFYRSSMERFFLVGIWLAVGFTILRLSPPALLFGFVVGQLVWIFANWFQRERA